MTKKIILLITLSSLFIFSGCSTSTENQKLASVEVYSSDKQTLLTTIEDKESLNTFNENTSMTDQWEKMADDDAEQQEHIEEELGNYKAKNIFIVYQTSKAVISSDLEEMMEITVYENTNIVEVKISPNTVKNILVSSEDLTYYYEVSDDVLEYLNSVAQNCSEADNTKEENKEEIAITSSSLTEEGKWISVITKSKGENKSPQLSWTPVENASCYAIYMFDKSAGNWLHWIAKDVTVTELELGAKLDNSEYIGPYPPSGDHEYVITVVALGASPDTYEGKFDNKNKDADKIIQNLDIANGKPSNILATGSISGTYKSGAIVE